VGNQIDILTHDLSFGHNLCCKYSNGSCEPIVDICVLINFQWSNELFNAMNFNLSNCFMKIWESIGSPNWDYNSQNGSPIGSVWAHSLTISCTPKSVNVIPMLHFQPAPFHALCFRHKPKVRVMIMLFWQIGLF
jgi:hypothetical protein